MNVGEDTTLGNGDVAKKLVQLLVVPDGELKVAGNDTGLLVVARSVASQLEDFGREVLKDGSEVDGSTGTDTLSVVALAEETVDTTNGEGETGLGRTTAQCQTVVKEAQRSSMRLAHDAGGGYGSEKTRQANARRVKDVEAKR